MQPADFAIKRAKPNQFKVYHLPAIVADQVSMGCGVPSGVALGVGASAYFTD